MPSAHFTWLSGPRGLLPFPSSLRSPAALVFLLSVSARPSARQSEAARARLSAAGCRTEAREAIPRRRRASRALRSGLGFGFSEDLPSESLVPFRFQRDCCWCTPLDPLAPP